MPKFVRARQGTGVLLHPETGALAAPDPSVPVAASDPLVKAFPWAFVSDEDLAAEMEAERTSFRPSAIEAARRADEAIAARSKAVADEEADAEKMAKARAAGKPQGDDAERDIASGDVVEDDPVEAATSLPGEKRTTRRR